MNIFLIILLVIVVLIGIILMGALLLKDEYIVEKAITINKPRHEVFNYIKLLKNQEQYNKWVMTDPKALKELRGTDGTPGAVYAWDSNNKQVGKGEQEIKKITEGERIDHEIRFQKPFEGTSFAHIITEPASANQTTVKWVFRGLRNYPMKIVHLLFNLKKMLGKDLEISLINLQSVLENNPDRKS